MDPTSAFLLIHMGKILAATCHPQSQYRISVPSCGTPLSLPPPLIHLGQGVAPFPSFVFIHRRKFSNDPPPHYYTFHPTPPLASLSLNYSSLSSCYPALSCPHIPPVKRNRGSRVTFSGQLGV